MGEHVRADDLDIWTEQVGEGPDVLPIGGLGDIVESWQFQLDGLADRYRLTAFLGRTSTPKNLAEVSFPQTSEQLTQHPEAATASDSVATAVREDGLRFRVEGPWASLTSDMAESVGGGASAPTPGWPPAPRLPRATPPWWRWRPPAEASSSPTSR